MQHRIAHVRLSRNPRFANRGAPLMIYGELHSLGLDPHYAPFNTRRPHGPVSFAHHNAPPIGRAPLPR